MDTKQGEAGKGENAANTGGKNFKSQKSSSKGEASGLEALLSLANAAEFEVPPKEKETEMKGTKRTRPAADSAGGHKKQRMKPRVVAKKEPPAGEEATEKKVTAAAPATAAPASSSGTAPTFQQSSNWRHIVPKSKNGSRHVSIAYYIYLQQRKSMMQCMGPTGKVPLSLDPTLEARLLKERTEWMKRTQKHKAEPPQGFSGKMPVAPRQYDHGAYGKPPPQVYPGQYPREQMREHYDQGSMPMRQDVGMSMREGGPMPMRQEGPMMRQPPTRMDRGMPEPPPRKPYQHMQYMGRRMDTKGQRGHAPPLQYEMRAEPMNGGNGPGMEASHVQMNRPMEMGRMPMDAMRGSGGGAPMSMGRQPGMSPAEQAMLHGRHAGT